MNSYKPSITIRSPVEDLITSTSTLQRRNFNLEGIAPRGNNADSNMMFHVYYTAVSPIYYELMPFVRAMKFANETDAINMLPSTWIKHVDDFNDLKFNQAHIPLNTKFIESQGIAMLCTITESKNRASFMQKIYDSKLKKIENDRIVESNRRLMELSGEITKLQEMNAQHKVAINQILDGIKLLTDGNANIIENLNSMVKNMKIN